VRGEKRSGEGGRTGRGRGEWEGRRGCGPAISLLAIYNQTNYIQNLKASGKI
jgi:hypothetical protein